MNPREHKPVGDHVRAETMRLCGWSVQRIAVELEVDRRTVYRWLNKYENTLSHERVEGTGPKRCSTLQQDQDLLGWVDLHPFVTCREARVETNFPGTVIVVNIVIYSRVRDSSGHKIYIFSGIFSFKTCNVLFSRPQGCDRTVLNRVRSDTALRCRVAAQREELSQEHRDARMVYANRFKNRPVEFWTRRFFSLDETIVSTNSDRKTLVYRPAGTRFEERYVKATHHSGRRTASFFGFISAHGTGPLRHIDRRMDSELYVECLRDTFLPTAKAIYPLHKIKMVHVSFIVSFLGLTFYLPEPLIVRRTRPEHTQAITPCDGCEPIIA